MRLATLALLALSLPAAAQSLEVAPGYASELVGYQGGGRAATYLDGDVAVINPISLRLFDTSGNLLSTRPVPSTPFGDSTSVVRS